MRNSRRSFLKGSSVAFLALSCDSISASVLQNRFSKNANYATYFIKDLQCESICKSAVDSGESKQDSADSEQKQHLALHAPRVLEVDGDISEIYAELKRAFESKAIVAGQSSEATLFVIRTMAAGYGLKVAYSDKKNGIRSWILTPTNITI